MDEVGRQILAVIAQVEAARKLVESAASKRLPKSEFNDDETVSPLVRASKQRHGAFTRGLRKLGYRMDGDYEVHPRGARVVLVQLARAWRFRSNAEILAVLSYVRRRPALCRELWVPA